MAGTATVQFILHFAAVLCILFPGLLGAGVSVADDSPSVLIYPQCW